MFPFILAIPESDKTAFAVVSTSAAAAFNLLVSGCLPLAAMSIASVMLFRSGYSLPASINRNTAFSFFTESFEGIVCFEDKFPQDVNKIA